MAEMATKHRYKWPRPRKACDPCHERKVRCDQQKPCNPCVRADHPDRCKYAGTPASPGPVAGHVPPTTPSDVASGPSGSTVAASRLSTASNRTGSSYSVAQGEEVVPERHQSRAQYSHKAATEDSLVHYWVGESPLRGRSHYSWVLRELEGLMSYIDKPRTPLLPSEGRAYDQREVGPAYRNLTSQGANPFPTTLFDEYPPREVVDRLLSIYFRTVGTVFEILSAQDFYESYEELMQNPRSAKLCFTVEVLLVISLANATLPEHEAPISRAKCMSWLELASSVPGTAMEIREFDLETVRMWALINLNRQVFKADDLANYIYTGSAVRAGIAIGLHRKNTWQMGGARHGLWIALLELDVESCLSAGSIPSLPSMDALGYPWGEITEAFEWSASESTSGTGPFDRALTKALIMSLPIRYKIVSTINLFPDYSLDMAMEMSRELNRTMSAVLSAGDTATASFQYRSILFLHRIFLAAIHRPLALLNTPALHYSQKTASAVALQHVKEVKSAYEEESPSAFSRLLSTEGTLFGTQTSLSVLILCFELYKPPFDDGLVGLGEDSQAAIRQGLQSFLESAGDSISGEIRNLPDTAFIAHMAIGHSQLAESEGRGTDQYQRQMLERATQFANS